jgi:hypothetical protein
MQASNHNGRSEGGALSPTKARLELIAPSASAEEAAAIVAALERFMRDTAPARTASPACAPDPWWRAGILEGVEGDAQPELREPWMSG